jgi:WD40 repeat protein
MNAYFCSEYGQEYMRNAIVNRSGRYDTQDSLYDTAWSEAHENQIITACGDGSVKLFDISLKNFPVQSWQEHSREVYSVSWNLVSKDTFASSSWDGTIKIVGLTTPRYTPQFGLSRWLTSQLVVSSTSNLSAYPPHTLLHLQQRLLTAFTIHCLVGFI